ncbi:Tubulin--tyrosine ligase-like protein 12 [Holothuria leucospilota]|uniref:Tubulin--tyrosine ligase-like protein 12 n=1 Tax=Holothuria leucospilota TaxID=206669 RepID=A0A9Q1C8A3_HOLLE|nr:Tubulin--tyrosine ligase-like protein 12 [Holothuria leucospilota]
MDAHVTQKKLSFRGFVELHEGQLRSSGVPDVYWESLQEKLENEIFDAGNVFMLTYVDEDLSESSEQNLKVVVSREEGVKVADGANIFLVDHAWTYRLSQARSHLTQMPQLVDRMEKLMHLSQTDELDSTERINRILRSMWKYNQTYNIANQEVSPENRQPFWYILDEFGSSIHHADEPSFRMVPFFYIPGQIAFSLLFPLKDVEYGGDVTRDYANHITESIHRDIALLPWQTKDFTFIAAEPPEIEESYLKRVCNETWPENDGGEDYKDLTQLDRKIKVFTDVELVQKALKHEKFELVQNEEEADVLWYHSQVKDFRKIASHGQHVNQFPCEALIITKDMLAYVSTNGEKDEDSLFPKWLPVTFDLLTAKPQFVSYFQQRARENKDNVWIIKPYNLSRGLDTCITDDLNQIIRLTETSVPKVACQYITKPVLYHREGIGGVKFDLRFIVLLTSLKPLGLYTCQTFWPRFANIAFTNDTYDLYEKHYTVMNYVPNAKEKLHQVIWKDFIVNFQSQYPDHNWNDVRKRIHDSIREFFEAATTKKPPRGLFSFKGSRAMYGLDLMLQWAYDDTGKKYMQPMLLECNFSADCERAVQQRAEYFDDLFSTMFLNDTTDRPIIKLV